MAGVLIAPASPPVPRLSVLPAAIDVGPGELTTPPSAIVNVPTSGPQPQPTPPIVSDVAAFKTEPAPVTVTVEAPVTSPMNIGAVALTVPPLATVSTPGPSVLPPPTKRAGPPTFQVEPGPVTSTEGVPSSTSNVSISAPPWLLSTPPLLMVREPGAKLPMNVCSVTVTLEPAPVSTALPATPKCEVVSVPPLVRVSEPPLIVSAGAEQLKQSVRPPMVPILPPKLAPVSVSEAALSSSSEPAPENLPENVVAPLPTMLSREDESEGPTVTVPPPASDAISAKPPLPTVRAAPALTVKPGSSEGLLMMLLVMVKVAPF